MQQTATQAPAVKAPLWRLAGMLFLLVILIAIALSLPRIAQPLDYHSFADQRTMLSIPHALNVLSNLPFIIFGVMGLVFVFRMSEKDCRRAFVDRINRLSYLIMFGFVLLTGIGSSYYHFNPTNDTLYWDRLPLTVVFMAFFGLIIGERVSPKAGAVLLGPLIALGIASVTYWRWSEAQGAGDIRFYALVQFGGILLITMLLLLFPSRYSRAMDFYIVLGWYMLAKVLEHNDQMVFDVMGQQLSGHTLKHLAAAMASLWLISMLRNRQSLPTANSADFEQASLPSDDSIAASDTVS
jgi:hypothetical protein